MSDLNDFYNSILNIDTRNKDSNIKKIVLEEKEKVLQEVKSLEGFCKYLANQIEYRLKKEVPGIHVYSIDFDELIGLNHTILIAEYKKNTNMKRLLIDPSFSQFVKKDNNTLINLEEWPSDRINKQTLEELLNNGLIEINNEIFRDYLNSFGLNNLNFDLDKDILESKIGLPKTK